MTEPVVVECSHATEVWYCEQPEVYVVLEDRWDLTTEPPTRHVYKVEARQA